MYIPEESKKRFREKTVNLIREIESNPEFKKENPKLYENFKTLISVKQGLKDYYKERFEEQFYGTEAFAMIFESKVLNVDILTNNAKTESPVMYSINYNPLPKDWMEFYIGCLDSRFYFNNNKF
jgi:hypothetical protein